MAAFLAILGLLATGLALTGIAWAVSWWMGKGPPPAKLSAGEGCSGGQRPNQQVIAHDKERF